MKKTLSIIHEQKTTGKIIERCCDFAFLETKARDWIISHHNNFYFTTILVLLTLSTACS